MKKVCPGCQQSVNLTLFAFKNKAAGTRQPYCNECRQDKAKQSYLRNKKNIVNAVIKRQQLVRDKYYKFKKTQICLNCGENESCCLTFHHTDPSTKEFEVAAMTSQAWSRIEKEIKKCVCLCANCHAKVHAGIISL